MYPLNSGLSVFVACVFSATAVHAGPIGSSAEDAAYSAKQLQQAGINTSGVYWFDADGVGGAAAFQTWADMTTDGGGWMLVRRVAGIGGWINVSDNLHGTEALNANMSTVWNASTSWSLNYSSYTSAAGSFLFSAGNGSAWGVLDYDSVFGVNESLSTLNSLVLASGGVAVTAGSYTNVLNRSGFTEDPWIGFQGDHSANISRMMYGEDGWGNGFDSHSVFKNSNDGINIWIREIDTPPLATSVPEPVTNALLLAGLGLMGLVVRRRNCQRAIIGRRPPRCPMIAR